MTPTNSRIEAMYAPRYVRRAVAQNKVASLSQEWRAFFSLNGIPKKLLPFPPGSRGM